MEVFLFGPELGNLEVNCMETPVAMSEGKFLGKQVEKFWENFLASFEAS